MKQAYENGDRFHFYLSGPMTGLPGDQIMNRSWYMRKDIQALLQSDAVMMLQDWEQSEGARLEFEIAKQLELPVKFMTINPKGEV